MKYVFKSNEVNITIFAAKSEELALVMLERKLKELLEDHGVELPSLSTFKLIKTIK